MTKFLVRKRAELKREIYWLQNKIDGLTKDTKEIEEALDELKIDYKGTEGVDDDEY